MESSSHKSHIALLFICILFISSATPILGCGSCGKKPSPAKPQKPKSPSKSPPKSSPVLPVPPVKVPPVNVPVPPVKVPPINVPVPPVTVPPVVPLPPLPVPPVLPLPPLPVPPVLPLPPLPLVPVLPLPPLPVISKPPPPSSSPATPCPPPASAPAKKPETCPIDTLKLGGCVDLLGGMAHVVLGDPAANECCPVLKGLVEAEAAACLCTTFKIKALDLNIYVPIALQLLVTCGKTPPPGYTCSV